MTNQWNPHQQQQNFNYGNTNTNTNFNGGGPSYGNPSQNGYFNSYASFDPYGMMGGSMLNMGMNMGMNGPPPNQMQPNNINNNNHSQQNNNNININKPPPNPMQNNGGQFDFALAPPPNMGNNPPPNMNNNPPPNRNNNPPPNNINPMNVLQNMAQQGSFYGPPPVNNPINPPMNNPINPPMNNFAMNAPIPPMNNPMNNPMNILQTMAQQGSFYGPPPVNVNMMNSMNNLNINNNMGMNNMNNMNNRNNMNNMPPMNNMGMKNINMPPPPQKLPLNKTKSNQSNHSNHSNNKNQVVIKMNSNNNNNNNNKNNGINYYDQKLKGKISKKKPKRKETKKQRKERKRREKEEKKEQTKAAASGGGGGGGNFLAIGGGGGDDYGLSAPKPRQRNQKKIGGRIRNSFLMTSSNMNNNMGFNTNPLMGGIVENGGGNKQIGFRDQKGGNNNHSKKVKRKRDINAIYSERRKKKVSYSKKETDKMKAKLLSSDKKMKKIASVKDIKQQNKLIMKKIHLCKYICDFRAAGSGIIILDKSEKIRIENKYNLLIELGDHLKRSDWYKNMGIDLHKFFESLFKMMSHNLFRVLPDGYIIEAIKTDTTGKDAKVTVTKELPAWKHFSLIYSIFEQVLICMKNTNVHFKVMIIENLENFNVISNMVYLLNSEEVREEEMIANIIILLYKHYGECRMFILGQLSNVCYSYLYLNNRDYSIGNGGGIDLYEKNKIQKEYSKQLASSVKTVLMIFRECLSNLKDMEQIDGWVELLCKVIIPLHKICIEEFIIFDDALGKISMTFCEKYFLSFIYIFQGMLRYWPMTSSKKEQLFLHRIGPLLDSADEDIWEFKSKMKCEFRDVFTKLSNKMVDSIINYQHAHYATIEKIVEMLEDDTLQRFLDIYGGKNCWIKLYKSMYDVSKKYFWKETIDKTLEFMENCKEEDDIPMQYVTDFDKIEKNKYDKYIEKKNNDMNEYIIENNRIENKRIKRKKYYQYLNKKYEKKNIAKYQKHVYKNNQPMLRLQQQENHFNSQPSINWNSHAMKELTQSMESLKKHEKKNSKYKIQKKHKVSNKKRLSQKTKPLPISNNKNSNNKNSNKPMSGLPPPIWDDDDF